jgi:hypothetical protein
MARSEETIQLEHPEEGKSAPRIAKTKYNAVRKAILRAVPKSKTGLSFKDLSRKVPPLLPKDVRSTIGSVMWYVVTVKLDLEARGEIERVPGSGPQRLRRR